MSVQTVTMYRLVCDWPDCEVSAQDDGEFFAWADTQGAISDAESGDWLEGRDGESYYCRNHPSWWASVDGDKPEPPYLLIHDGDTHDDGKVTLIGGAA